MHILLSIIYYQKKCLHLLHLKCSTIYFFKLQKKEELMNIIGNCSGENCGLKVPRRNKTDNGVYKTHYPLVYFNCGHVEKNGDPKKKRGECPTCSEVCLLLTI